MGLWDAVAFDEVADLQKMPKEVVTTLKTYCESGTFARGKEQLSGTASIAMFGNTNQPVDVMVRSSSPLRTLARGDPGGYGLSGSDSLLHSRLGNPENADRDVHDGATVLSWTTWRKPSGRLRRHNFTEAIDHHFGLGSQLKSRDVKAVRKTVAGLIKLIHPHGQVSQDDLRELLELALEGRRRVKEQLKKMGSFEFFQTSFSYIEKETGEERYVGVPEEGGRNLIATDPMEPGGVYAASVDEQGKVGLSRIEVGCSSGSGKLKLAGGIDGLMKESIQRAFGYLHANKVRFGIGHDFDTTDFHVEAIDLLQNRVSVSAALPSLWRSSGSETAAGAGGAGNPRRHQHSGKHQRSSDISGTVPACDGEWCPARADSD